MGGGGGGGSVTLGSISHLATIKSNSIFDMQLDLLEYCHRMSKRVKSTSASPCLSMNTR